LLQRAGFALLVTGVDNVTVHYEAVFSLTHELQRTGRDQCAAGAPPRAKRLDARGVPVRLRNSTHASALYFILTTLAERRSATGRIETSCVITGRRDLGDLDDAANGRKSGAA
jgi:hypothetical protein